MFPFLCSGGVKPDVARVGTPNEGFDLASHSTLTFSVTIATGADFAFVNVIDLGFSAPPTIDSLTLDGVACTLITNSDSGGFSMNGGSVRFRSYGLVAPNIGTYNCVITYASSVLMSHAGVQAYSGVNQTTPTEGAFKHTAAQTASATQPKVISPTTTTVSGDYLAGGFISSDAGGGLGDLSTNGSEIGENWDNVNTGSLCSSADKAITGSGANIGWTNSEFRDWAGTMVVIKRAA
jgi:hypothetical protein